MPMNRINTRVEALDARDGFSLVEMLMVIAIIALLIAILLPALNGARDTALKVSTQSMMADFTNATQRFGNDNAGRNPGYFTEAQMGHSDNEVIGMSAIENAMIELGGTSVVIGSEANPDAQGRIDPDSGIIAIGPRNSGDVPNAVINLNLIGGQGAYFSPDNQFWRVQDHRADLGGQFGTPAAEGQVLMPDLVDAWGNPMLGWAKDPSAPGSVFVGEGADAMEVYRQVARLNSDGLGDPDSNEGPAWFYAASNAAFLEAESFGSSSINMAADPTTGRASVLSSGVNDDERLRSLASVLASPSSYQLDPAIDGIGNASFEDIFPSTARGRFIIHSAGSDGVFMSSQDQGWSENANTDTGYRMDFGNSFLSQSDQRYIDDKNGSFTSIDLAEPFDDLLFGSK
ncbi:MAG: prepilin-type N-terminal cleavage/methylation domain-containing protein [Phycisphaerales bacterium]